MDPVPGFDSRRRLTPGTEADVGILQPHVFVGEELFGFWGGIVGIPDDARSRFYAAVGKAAFDVFPIRVRVDPDLSRGNVEMLLDGWQGAGDQEANGGDCGGCSGGEPLVRYRLCDNGKSVCFFEGSLIAI